jgi:hypothetical protein
MANSVALIDGLRKATAGLQFLVKGSLSYNL